jgi:FMN-dependent NADH-azoreductase
MKKLFHIIATPRGEESRTLKVSEAFLEAFRSSHPDWGIDELNLFETALPELTAISLDGKYILLAGKELSSELREVWEEIVSLIEQFISYPLYLLSVPMWNFSIPYKLKQYLDIIVQPKYMFHYTSAGAEGLLKGKKMVIVTSRGGDYAQEAKSFDFQEPYLRTLFGFVGIGDITFLNAQPMDALGQEVQKEKIEQAQELARKIASSL